MTVFHSMLNNTFSVVRLVKTPDSQGGWQDSYQSIAPIVGRLRPASSSEIVSAQQEARQITHILYTEINADIARGDRVTLGDLVVDIMALREPSRADHHLEIDALEVQKQTTLDIGS